MSQSQASITHTLLPGYCHIQEMRKHHWGVLLTWSVSIWLFHRFS